MRETDYASVLARRDEILQASTGIDYRRYTDGGVGLDYEGLMRATGYDPDDVRRIQRDRGVGGTPMLELGHITELVRRHSPPGYGAR
ncbi:MAG: PLP-dependent lyase/thiolase, partial [Pseudonocardiaceae bacterium]|nr:PLP-dependent lyase/thiolase [Pseudonocardiaceae bacterium]